jgi:hypothetical protein
MSQDRGLGIGDRAGVERLPETPHAGRYFVTDAILLAGHLEQTHPITRLPALASRTLRQAGELHELISDASNWETVTKNALHFRKCEQVREHLLLIAATAMQAAKQLGLDSRQDAIAKEIPF